MQARGSRVLGGVLVVNCGLSCFCFVALSYMYIYFLDYLELHFLLECISLILCWNIFLGFVWPSVCLC
ncbi:hypothetical protein IC575_004531 [Cucumis melo]